MLSSFNSALNSAATLFTLEVYQVYINRDASEKQLVRVGTIFGVLCAICSFIMAPGIEALRLESFYDFMQHFNTLNGLPILILFVLGVFFTKLDSFSAKVAFAVSLICYTPVTFFDTRYWMHLYFLSAAVAMMAAIFSYKFRIHLAERKRQNVQADIALQHSHSNLSSDSKTGIQDADVKPESTGKSDDATANGASSGGIVDLHPFMAKRTAVIIVFGNTLLLTLVEEKFHKENLRPYHEIRFLDQIGFSKFFFRLPKFQTICIRYSI